MQIACAVAGSVPKLSVGGGGVDSAKRPWASKLAAAEIRLDEGWQAANRKGLAAMTGKSYCGNLLWQSSLTLLPLASAA